MSFAVEFVLGDICVKTLNWKYYGYEYDFYCVKNAFFGIFIQNK